MDYLTDQSDAEDMEEAIDALSDELDSLSNRLDELGWLVDVPEVKARFEDATQVVGDLALNLDKLQRIRNPGASR